jgi:F0F1-type ATP synthase assembly protein I
MQGRDRGEAFKGANEAWDVIGVLLSGIIVVGGLGWLLDLAFDLHYLFLPIGMVLGVGIAIWMVYLKHGRTD